MDSRQPLPRLWMMTDERQGDGLLPALDNLPEGAGAVFRHYSLEAAERRTLFQQVRGVTRRRNLLLMLAGPPDAARAWGASGSHGWDGAGDTRLLRSVSVHDEEEVEAANRLGADFVFVSPVFGTRSHPRAAPLGPEGLKALAARAEMPVIALGGMNSERAERLGDCGIYGWAGIDAWTR